MDLLVAFVRIVLPRVLAARNAIQAASSDHPAADQPAAREAAVDQAMRQRATATPAQGYNGAGGAGYQLPRP